jgi:hypothetical protein
MATLAASCSATTGTVRFHVSDGSLNETGDLQLNVTLTPPTLGSYADATVPLGQGTLVSPDAAPMDNGSVTELLLYRLSHNYG